MTHNAKLRSVPIRFHFDDKLYLATQFVLCLSYTLYSCALTGYQINLTNMFAGQRREGGSE